MRYSISVCESLEVGESPRRGEREHYEEGQAASAMLVREAEVRVASARTCLADAKATLRHAGEAEQAHRELEMVGEVWMNEWWRRQVGRRTGSSSGKSICTLVYILPLPVGKGMYRRRFHQFYGDHSFPPL